MRVLSVLAVAAALLACSSDSDTQPPVTPVGSGGSGGTQTAGGGDSGGMGTGGIGTGGMGSGGMGSGGVPSGGPVDPNIVQSDLYVNCQPGVSSDPVHGGFIVDYDNTAGMVDGVAQITAVRVEFSRIVDMMPETLSWGFAVTPTHSGLVAVGNTTQIEHSKVFASGKGSGMGAPCDWCSDSWRLEVDFQTDGMPVTKTRNLTGVSCVY